VTDLDLIPRVHSTLTMNSNALNLKTLGHPNPDKVNVNDVQQLRGLVLWLEDAYIKSGSCDGLRDTYGPNWQTNFNAFLQQLGFPRDWYATEDGQVSLVDGVFWIVGQAVQKQYAPRAKELNVRASARMIDAVDLGDTDSPAKKPKVVSSNPIENMDFQSNEFKEGVKRLQKLLEVPDIHPDHLVSLEASCKIIQTRLNQKCLMNPGKVVPKGETFDLKDHSFGVSEGGGCSDPAVAEAMKILRLTHLHHLRDLQSEINAAIETVQAATANPKTDTRLGKVGR